MNGEMVLVKNDISATWKAMEELVASGGSIKLITSPEFLLHIQSDVMLLNG
jgi:hypothetical protein